ncbi:MAG: hypothetical protein C4326_05850 [Ignavibacteria bacterium]
MRNPYVSKRRRLLLAATVVLGAYLAVIAWFAVREDSYVYFPRKGLRNADSLALGIETVSLRSLDGVMLKSWIVPASDTSNLWILYLHGNGGNISSRGYIEHYNTLRALGVNIFAVDYRGYGESEGIPSEDGLYQDARAAFDYLVNARGVLPERIVIFGYSLGSAVAVHLATEVDARAVILEGAFTSAYRLGQAQYPFLPISLMMRNRFDTLSKMHGVSEPKLFLHAREDEVVPFEHGTELFAAAPEPKTFVAIRGGHNDAHSVDSAAFYGAIAEFLRSLRLHH